MKNNSNAGIGFSGLLTISFVVLKLCGVIKWSWWAVFSPLLAEIVILIIFVWFIFFKN